MKKHFDQSPQGRFKQAGVAAGFNTFFSGIEAAIGPVPIAGATGFVVATNTPSKKPFFLGCLLIAAISLFPSIINTIAMLPPAVAYAVTFVIFTKMVRLAFYEWQKEKNQERGLTVIGVSWMTGVGLMFVP
ncbi:hypothetical protein KP78_28610 [Jeotgalibacillus soli]|uniref:Xanthine/uracil/vitamin C permease n=1 Tax=Jeotgalibacillus soli TaxID=889306 RepID=A0A0C2V8N2_9BACL|nr:hypothetical protein KP78_28610 [Jeotgalibacillus soli]